MTTSEPAPGCPVRDDFDPLSPLAPLVQQAQQILLDGCYRPQGASLGRLETRIAIEQLVRRFPRLGLVDGQQLSFHPNISFRGPQALLVRPG